MIGNDDLYLRNSNVANDDVKNIYNKRIVYGIPEGRLKTYLADN